MTHTHPVRNVVVVGGGVVGLASAWRLARDGVAVTVVERARAGRAASWVAAGMLAPISESGFGDDVFVAFARAGMARYPSFLDELAEDGGGRVALNTQGTLVVARDRDDAELIRRVFDYRRGVGLPVEWLGGDEARDAEPALSPRVVSAMHIPDDHQVDSRELIGALLAACQTRGVTLREETAVSRVLVENGRVIGVTTGDKTMRADAVVIAAGAWSGSIDGIPTECVPPVRPVRGQIVRLRAAGDFALRYIVRGPRAYLLPKPDGTVIAGATVEEMGFDLTATAGGVGDILRHAWELVPGVYDLPLETVDVGLRPGSRDHRPVIGEAMPGLIMATGHYRHGILLAPITADAVADGFMRGTFTHAGAFSPARFGSGVPHADHR
jgi:glycine oxidase